jgi:hypothetical protein
MPEAISKCQILKKATLNLEEKADFDRFFQSQFKTRPMFDQVLKLARQIEDKTATFRLDGLGCTGSHVQRSLSAT